MVWFSRAVAAAALVVVAWACLTAWPAIVHGNPAYAVLLALTVVVAVISLVRSLGEPR
jgi:cation transport ATPase